VLKSELDRRYKYTQYVNKSKMCALDDALKCRRRKGVMTKSKLRKKLMEDLKHERQ
jgi:hypothetical protein